MSAREERKGGLMTCTSSLDSNFVCHPPSIVVSSFVWKGGAHKQTGVLAPIARNECRTILRQLRGAIAKSTCVCVYARKSQTGLYILLPMLCVLVVLTVVMSTTKSACDCECS